MAKVKRLIMYGVNVQIPSCPDVIFILHRDIHSFSQLHFHTLAKVCVISPLSRITSLVCTSHLNYCIPSERDNCIRAHFATQRTSGSRRKPSFACLRARTRQKRCHSRVSQCFNLSASDFRLHKGPRASLR